MKKLNLFIVAIIAMLSFSINAKAANGISLSCDKTQIGIGESTNCTVSIVVDAEIEPINAAIVTLSSSKYLTISNTVANATAGWAVSKSGTNESTGKYAFNNTTGGKSGQLFSFTLTLNEAAKALGEGDDCGELCISGAQFGSTTLTNVKGTGTCFAPVIVEEEKCPGGKCPNPETGAFANYAIIASSIIIAGAAVVVARKSTKFFRV